jgi:hypothetical protein
MLLDGFTYARIRREISAEGINFNDMVLSRWRNGGYQDWLTQRDRLALINSRFADLLAFLGRTDPAQLSDISLGVASARLAEFLAELDSARVSETAQSDPPTLVRLLNLVPRIARESLNLRQYRNSMPPADSSENLGPDRDLARHDSDAILRGLEKALGNHSPP